MKNLFLILAIVFIMSSLPAYTQNTTRGYGIRPAVPVTNSSETTPEQKFRELVKVFGSNWQPIGETAEISYSAADKILTKGTKHTAWIRTEAKGDPHHRFSYLLITFECGQDVVRIENPVLLSVNGVFKVVPMSKDSQSSIPPKNSINGLYVDAQCQAIEKHK